MAARRVGGFSFERGSGSAYGARIEHLQRLRILKTVGEAGSFGRAAEVLHMSQPAVSQHVAALERELGSSLVQRSPRGVQLTAAGRVVHGHALAVLRIAGDIRRELSALAQSGPRALRIAAFPSACTGILPAALRRFRDEHPRIEIELSDLDTDAAVTAIGDGQADVALVFDDAVRPLTGQAVTFEHVFDDPLLVALPRDHAMAAEAELPLTDLVDQGWIGGTHSGCDDALRAICATAGFVPSVPIRTSRYPTTLAMVAAGHGIALLPGLATVPPDPRVVLRPLRPAPPPRRVWVVTPPHVRPSPDTTALLVCLHAAVDDGRRADRTAPGEPERRPPPEPPASA